MRVTGLFALHMVHFFALGQFSKVQYSHCHLRSSPTPLQSSGSEVSCILIELIERAVVDYSSRSVCICGLVASITEIFGASEKGQGSEGRTMEDDLSSRGCGELTHPGAQPAYGTGGKGEAQTAVKLCQSMATISLSSDTLHSLLIF